MKILLVVLMLTPVVLFAQAGQKSQDTKPLHQEVFKAEATALQQADTTAARVTANRAARATAGKKSLKEKKAGNISRKK